MTRPFQDLTDVQIEFLGQVFGDGNSQVSGALEMLTGQPIEQASVHIEVTSAEHVGRVMNFPRGPMAVVVCAIQGDIGGNFLFLQTEQDLQVLSHLMGPILSGQVQHPASTEIKRPVPTWLIEKRLQVSNIRAQMMDIIGELGNTLFGGYLMSLHKNCGLTVYQSVPETSLMNAQQSVFGRIRALGGRASSVAVVFEINYKIEKFALKAWLVLLPQFDGLCKILDEMRARNPITSHPAQIAHWSNKGWDI